MALNSDTYTFKGITNIYHDQFNQNLLHGLLGFLRWSALEAGAFQNVDRSNASGVLGGHPARLRPVRDPNFTDGQVWEGFRGDWVWETGVSYSTSPTVNSGVWVGNNLYLTASETGVYSHYVDFPNGRVVFNSPIATSSVVTADFAHRTISFVKASEHWGRELMFESYRIDRADFLTGASGQWAQSNDVRRALPLIGIYAVGRSSRPYELGGGQWVDQDITMTIITENNDELDQWIDILTMQNDRTVWLPNRKRMKDSANYPLDLDYRGVPVSGAMTYPQIITPTGDGGFAWTNAVWTNTTSEKLNPPAPLFAAEVHATFTVILH